jgi:hypothetical protein
MRYLANCESCTTAIENIATHYVAENLYVRRRNFNRNAIMRKEFTARYLYFIFADN